MRERKAQLNVLSLCVQEGAKIICQNRPHKSLFVNVALYCMLRADNYNIPRTTANIDSES